MQIVTSWMRQGIEQGLEQGIGQGEKSLILMQLEHKLGELSADVARQVENLSQPQLEQLGRALLGFTNIQDLVQWLTQS